MTSGSADIMQRVEAWDELVVKGMVATGWTPAQHDTNAQDVISMLNAEADREANKARIEKSPQHKWKVPRCWCDGDTLFYTKDGTIVCDPKKSLTGDYEWQGSDTPATVAMLPWPEERRPDAQIRKAWIRVGHLVAERLP